MNFFKKYQAYIKDNPQGYWFKAKCYGWGWTPATKEGLFVTLGLIILVLLLALKIDENSSVREVMFTFVLPTFLLVALFIRIAYAKGEKPRWNWGSVTKKNKK